MVWKKAEPSEFFHEGQKSIITEKIREAGGVPLREVLGELNLSKNDWIASRMGRVLVVPTSQVKAIRSIQEISANLEAEHVVEDRGIGLGRRLSDRVSIVEEILTPHPSKILATNEDVIQIIKKAVEKDDRRAISALKEMERKGSMQDIAFNSDVNSVEELLNRDWELISSRARTRLTGKLMERVKSTPAEKLLVDIHTHDKIMPESDVPSTRDYLSIRGTYRFDWFAICKSTNIESMKSSDLMEDVIFFYSGKGAKPHLDKMKDAKKIKDEDERSQALYDLRFELYHRLKADLRTYGQITG